MDAFTINLDMVNKDGMYVSSRVLGAYSSVTISVYNFRADPDLSTMSARIAIDTGTVITSCSSFEEDAQCAGKYNASMSLSTPASIEYFSAKSPNFSKDLCLTVSDSKTMYCSSMVSVKNNPNALTVLPLPVEV